MTTAPSLRSARTTLGGKLALAAEALGLPLPAPQAEQLLDYLELLEKWNRTYNLTAVRDPVDMLTQHLVDCLAAVPPLRREAPGRRLLDVGSGGGLPGIVWAIIDPEREVTCVDSVGKKAAFVRQAALALRLRNLHSEHARVEQLRADPFDVVSSRAFASLADFTSLTRDLLKADGIWLAMKGKEPIDEMAELGAEVRVFHVEPMNVPGLDAERCIVWMRKPSPAKASNESGHSQ